MSTTPLAIGLTSGAAHAAPVAVTIVGSNDFHGRLIRDNFGIPGAAYYASAVDSIRADNPNTVFAAAGDLIGATTFESFINQDKPTIDVLNAMGLDVSAVGNHELDKGWDDLTQRVMQPESDANPKGGALWEYIAANLIGPAGEEELIEDSWVAEVAGARIGFVGAVTEDLPSLVSPAGIEGVQVTDVVDAVNTEADRLVAEESADMVVMLVHEGAPRTDCATMTDPSTTWGNIVSGVNTNVDAIISGHTHLAYNCSIAGRPVVSAGQYGAYLNRLDFTVDPEAGTATLSSQQLVDVYNGGFAPDAEVQAIVDQAVEDAKAPGSVPLGEIAAPFNRARQSNGTSENRGGESSLGNEVAEAQRWATGTDIAFMNPGGLRNDMKGNPVDPAAAEPVYDYPTDLTYRQAAEVQPFANTIVTMDMTGAQIETLLEQQWQPGKSRPFLKLGVSEGFSYTYESYDSNPDPGVTAMRGEIDRMWLDGQAVRYDRTYRVAANSFIAAGGDSFAAFTEATGKRDSGQVDLEAMVDYMAEFASGQPLAPDFGQRAVGVSWPEDAPSSYGSGDQVTFDLSSLAMTAPGDRQDQRLVVRFDGKRIGTTPVDNSVVDTFDEAGRATVDVVLPRYAGDPDEITLVGRATGTRLTIPFATEAQSRSMSEMGLARKPQRVVRGETRTLIRAIVLVDGEPAAGRVVMRGGGQSHLTRLDDRGRAVVRFQPFDNVGRKVVRVRYLGDDATRGTAQKIGFRVHRR
ncbi:bifunctional metallophosphatase/5'-nucleotidase [Nocardioides coralli]|uniref:bifunctional metallophosphatase/5'-nucleotidase n=1 Tax=Nocardioides coralli TaxID=2872154 RepID=UPI001CA3E938|nr:bifunctional UDP-sugar hydrolase/5'-nucleotidase [Nocardioides coralli]QZY30402.1 bifunctional metallophosphatase/5'-nucleotidase [Nocardioides coralli]